MVYIFLLVVKVDKMRENLKASCGTWYWNRKSGRKNSFFSLLKNS